MCVNVRVCVHVHACVGLLVHINEKCYEKAHRPIIISYDASIKVTIVLVSYVLGAAIMMLE